MKGMSTEMRIRTAGAAASSAAAKKGLMARQQKTGKKVRLLDDILSCPWPLLPSTVFF